MQFVLFAYSYISVSFGSSTNVNVPFNFISQYFYSVIRFVPLAGNLQKTPITFLAKFVLIFIMVTLLLLLLFCPKGVCYRVLCSLNTEMMTDLWLWDMCLATWGHNDKTKKKKKKDFCMEISFCFPSLKENSTQRFVTKYRLIIYIYIYLSVLHKVPEALVSVQVKESYWKISIRCQKKNIGLSQLQWRW